MQNFPGEISVLDSSKVARPLLIPSLQYAFLGMNLYAPKSNMQAHPIFSDVRVRRALSMAVNRVDMLRNVFGDQGLLAHGPFPMILSASDTHREAAPVRHRGRLGPSRLRRLAARPRWDASQARNAAEVLIVDAGDQRDSA